MTFDVDAPATAGGYAPRPAGRARVRAHARAQVAPPHAPLPQVAPRELFAGLAGGGVVVTALWAAQVELSARLDALFATAAHLAGLLGGYGILVMLFLMARVPAVEHGVGADRLARWHARGGRYTFGLIAAHAVLALCGYAAFSGLNVPSAAVCLLDYPGVALAVVGTAMLGALAVTSARAVRRRVRHETWKSIHLLAYVAGALCFVHQLGGPDIAGSVFTVWLWSLMHATVGVLLAWYRVVVPVRSAMRHTLRVVAVRAEGPGVVSVVIAGRHLEELQAESGQFFRWRFVTRRLWRTALPFSLSAPVRDDTLRITVKALGDHTRKVRRLRPGVRVVATGPFGAMTAQRRTRHKVLLLAGGVGITPMRALFETLPGGPGDITLLYRAKDEEQLVLRGELEQIAAARGAGLHFLLGPSDAAMNPFAPAHLRALVPDIAEHDVYLCGPPGMADTAISALERAGVPGERIHTELFVF